MKKKKALPYSSSRANPIQAQQRIKEMLRKFGVDRINFDEDFLKAEVRVSFKYKEYPVTFPVNYRKLAEMYLEDDPWYSRKNTSEDVWNEKKRDIAYRASFSLIEDFLKGLITTVELGIFSFEEIFISYFVSNSGLRLGEVFTKNLPGLMANKALGTGENSE